MSNGMLLGSSGKCASYIATASGVLVPHCALFRDGVEVERSLVGRIVAELIRGAVPPLTFRDVLFMTSGHASIRSVTELLPAGARLDSRRTLHPMSYGVSVVAAIAPGLVASEGFDPEVLQFAHHVFKGKAQRRLAAHLDRVKERLSVEFLQGVGASLRQLIVRTDREFDRWIKEFCDWSRTRAAPAQTREGRRSPALAAIFEWNGRLLRQYMQSHVVTPKQAEAEMLSALLRKGASGVLARPRDDGELRTAQDFLHDVLFDHDPTTSPLGRYFVGRDGKIHRNSNRDADWLKSRTRIRCDQCRKAREECPEGCTPEAECGACRRRRRTCPICAGTRSLEEEAAEPDLGPAGPVADVNSALRSRREADPLNAAEASEVAQDRERRRLAALARLDVLESLNEKERKMVELSQGLLDPDEWGGREHYRRLREAGFRISQPGLLKMWRRVRRKLQTAT